MWIHRRAGVGKRTSNRNRIAAVDDGTAVVALGEAHHLPVVQIDRREQVDHHRTDAVAAMCTKLPSSARPQVLDFSGWN